MIQMKLKEYNFNSQPHEEADVNLFFAVQAADISTHSLTRRLTSRLTYPVEVNGISTHSLTRRLTAWARLKLKEMIFQLTASRGG